MTAPLRVAVVGSGPSGFYSAAELLALPDLDVTVDMFDRLPTPFGLVRAGVAPDHPKIKSVTRVFEKTAAKTGFNFYGNVEVGRDVDAEELAAAYDAVVYAQGADRGRRAGFPGEQLVGNHTAAAFVGWYNGHPDYCGADFNLAVTRAVVIGNGNVALDVARMLTMPVTALEATDIASHALHALRHSRIEEVVVLGRRGPEHAAFTAPELEELGALDGVDVVVDAADLPDAGGDDSRGKLSMLADFAMRHATPGNKRIVLAFHTRPIEAVGARGVERLRVQRDGKQHNISAGLVIHAVGYAGSRLAGLPFDDRRGVVCNERGRVLGYPGVYVAGWIKRGPNGVIGTNKACARETIEVLAADARAGALASVPAAQESLRRKLVEREVVDFGGWTVIDEHERAVGQVSGRPRIKITDVAEMVAVSQRRLG